MFSLWQLLPPRAHTGTGVTHRHIVATGLVSPLPLDNALVPSPLLVALAKGCMGQLMSVCSCAWIILLLESLSILPSTRLSSVFVQKSRVPSEPSLRDRR